MKNITHNIPNAITSLNIIGGMASIICATKGPAPLWGLTGFAWAYIFIGIAAVADFFDGFAARALQAYSPLGKELDSLCDLVSFGVAPSMLLLFTLRQADAQQWLQWCALFPAVCGAFRLARFNTSPEQNAFFTGLPIPANAIFWIGCTAWIADTGITSPWIILPAIIIMGWLMVSDIKLWSMKFKTYSPAANWPRYSLPLAALACCICMDVAGLMWTIIYYLILSIIIKPTGK